MEALIVVAALVAVAVVWWNWYSRQQRIKALRAVAAQLRFEFSAEDPGDVLGLPFELFERGDGRGVEHVMWGEHAGRPTRLFDYWFYDEHSDTKGSRHRSYSRFTCGLLTIGAACPHLRVAHENVLNRIGNALGLRDLELEYEDFNREFRVSCDDQRFAFSLLDARMMEWLLQANGFDSFETVGPYVLLAADKLDPADWPGLCTWFELFHDHVPDVVFSTYGPA